jgi:hypothetical protein
MDICGDIIIAKSKERRGLTHYKLIWEIPAYIFTIELPQKEKK